ncbi:MAG TPA: NPCBM/NEW2 domain-containing protein [Candidatus Paceibacterota bacterium]|nr:NPCBM/NEW2 domain-containing protein [Candidatus Paceibacterota bacterium]
MKPGFQFRYPAAILFLLGAAVGAGAGPGGAAASSIATNFLSDHPERLLVQNQAWGELGFDTAAHERHKAGEPLRIGQHAYAKGLGHHATGRLAVLLGGEFDRFEAEVGLQPCGGEGSVVFRVRVDGREAFDSGVMRTGDPPKTLSLSVEGAQELWLEAHDAGDGITCDMANWANARLVGSSRTRVNQPGGEVDVAPFGQVVTSDPKRTDGSRADRLGEYRAEDVFLETELQPDAGGGYVLKPDSDGLACIGLRWLSRRALKELRLKMDNLEMVAAAQAARVEGWFGESAWQGNWVVLEGSKSVEDDELVLRLSPKAPKGGLLQTSKVRWLIPTGHTPLRVRQLKAYTRSRWADVVLTGEAEGVPATAKGQWRVHNGTAVFPDGPFREGGIGWQEWDLTQPLKLRVRHATPSLLKGDATVLQFRLPAGSVGVGLEDLLTNGCVYVPSHGLFVAVQPAGGPALRLAEYKRRIAGRQSILPQVRQLPDQSLDQAMARTHHEAQRAGPVMLSLSCDNTKYVVDRDGELRFHPGDSSNGDWNAGAARIRPRFGDGRADRFERRLEGGWLPVPVMRLEREGVAYSQRVFAAPDDEDGTDPLRLNRRSVCVAEFSASNLQPREVEARIELDFRLPGQGAAPARLTPVGTNEYTAHYGEFPVRVVVAPVSPLEVQVEDGILRLAGRLPAKGRVDLTLFLGGSPNAPRTLAEGQRLRARVAAYWEKVLASATQIETPAQALNDIIRSSQVRCLIAARNEADGARVAPWIAAMAYGPLESEAHSVIRGMDFLGHAEFARRGLEYFIHRYNTNGFLTTGYTTFGTAWHLWTVGEHHQLTQDHDWLRRVAPELRRVGDWILRQVEKTRRLDPEGRPVPEYGLMPPGVMADWNSFACHFMMNGYYHAALRELGAALGSLEDDRAGAFVRGAAELRDHILRAYRWTQAQSPALPLRNGTWIPAYPSQVHSPGKLADFFPGDDAGRSWAYDVELGAHQLAPTGVIDPQDAEVSRMLDHMEDVQFLSDGWFDYPAAASEADWFNLGGFAKVQPYYARNAEIYALRDDVKPFLRSYFNSLASLLNPEVLTLWEHFHHTGAWDKTHETGYFLHQTRMMLVQERGDQLWLAPLAPEAWLATDKNLSVSNAPTRFGPVSFSISSRAEPRRVEVTVHPPRRTPPKAIVVRLRQPEKTLISRVEVNGQRHDAFSPGLQTITLESAAGPLTITAWY